MYLPLNARVSSYLDLKLHNLSPGLDEKSAKSIENITMYSKCILQANEKFLHLKFLVTQKTNFLGFPLSVQDLFVI